MEDLRERFERGAVVAGVLSGTSADGIDVVIARITARDGVLAPPETLAFAVEPLEDELRRRARGALDARAVALLSRDLGRAFGRAAKRVAERAGVRLDLVASHGQTVWHHDGVEPSGPATLQLGDGDCVAEEAGCAVASDFRARDVAAGGEGAPLSALADGLVFARAPRPAAILNLGGLANLTFLGAEEDEILAFDTGPAGSLLDGLARRLLDRPCDHDGAAAGAGIARRELLASLLEHPYFDRRPPKSTGRDTFGESYVDTFVRHAGSARAEDVLRTGVELVATSVVLALERFAPARPETLLVAGGGTRNRTLMRALAERAPCRVATSDEAGVDPKAREALVFAVLGARCPLGIPSTHEGATGARRGRVLGKLSRA